MTAQRKLSLLGGVAWNLRRWVELRRWGRAQRLADVVANADRGIEVCRTCARRINAIRVSDQLPFSG